jgi:hypothetical protein
MHIFFLTALLARARESHDSGTAGLWRRFEQIPGRVVVDLGVRRRDPIVGHGSTVNLNPLGNARKNGLGRKRQNPGLPVLFKLIYKCEGFFFVIPAWKVFFSEFFSFFSPLHSTLIPSCRRPGRSLCESCPRPCVRKRGCTPERRAETPTPTAGRPTETAPRWLSWARGPVRTQRSRCCKEPARQVDGRTGNNTDTTRKQNKHISQKSVASIYI